MKKIIKHKVLSALVNEEQTAAYSRQMFKVDPNFKEKFQEP
jgi:hypothetical protein